jgi:hypothetical protein
MLGRIASGHEEAPAALDDCGGCLDHRKTGAAGKLAEESEERSAVGGPDSGVPAGVRRMEEHHDLPFTVQVPAPVVVRETHRTIEHGSRRDGAHGDHDLRCERRQLGREERSAPAGLGQERASIASAGTGGRG